MELELDEPGCDKVVTLIRRVAADSPLFLRADEGRAFIAYCFTLSARLAAMLFEVCVCVW